MPPVPVTQSDMSSPEYKYFLRDMVPPAPNTQARVEAGELTSAQAHSIDHMNDLFLDGYLDGEFGYCQMPDGTLAVANLMLMPNITPAMFDWWFAWHGLAPIRYKLWNKDEHYDISTSNPERRRDASIPVRERIWDTIDYATEENPIDGLHTVAIHFRNPVDIGFDKALYAAFNGTIICAADEKSPVTMCHFVRPTENGSELRTRFWMGYSIVDRRPKKVIPSGFKMPIQVAKNVLNHCNKEFANLIAILPELYAEFRDIW
ncbi:MAG: DAPG hydrolase family protein [Saccharofermentanales bacterium]|jgi:hypothetical protein